MSDITRVTAIVPRLPPAVDGLGDYGLSLARQLRTDFGLVTDFVVGEPNWAGVARIEEFEVKQVAARSRAALLELLPRQPKATVLLHYVGYGYARRGCPVWLVEGLERWRQAESNRRLVTMFHEVYAYNPRIWTSQFWTSSWQKNLAARLAKASDRCLTSKQGYAKIISQLSQGKHPTITALPVFSNVGEPGELVPLVERPRRLVVFGGGGWRARVYQRSRLALERTCRELEIEEIIDIGSELGFKIEPVNGISVVRRGILSAREISCLLSSSVVGFFDYPTEFLAKSTIFAAYCAHQVLPVGVFYEGEDVDGLSAGRHYWLGDRHQGTMSLSAGQVVADNAYAWYQTHQISVVARAFATCLMANESSKVED